jgi:beta-lactamase regulating signal transducer with metallopeptidase domain
MTAALNLDQLARLCTERMLSCMLEGIAIGLFAWILLRVVGRRNSSTRFAVWFSALLAIAALPVFRGAASTASSSRAASVAAITLPGSWALGVFAIWAVVASLALARVGVGLWQLRRLRASCTPVDAAALDPVLRAALQGVQKLRSVQLCQSDRLPVPTAIGFLQPVVVIPGWAMRELSTAELNSILIHELAHLRRWDDWTNLVQQLLKALLFFHPAVWWIENKLALEREMACDDAVLAETANPRGYAQCLISMAEKSFLRRGLALAQAAVNRMHQTSLRVSQILDLNRSRATRVWKPALYSVAAFSVVCLVSLSHAPELVAFEDPMPDAAVASAKPASSTPVSDKGFVEKQAVATEASFRAPTIQHTVSHRIREGTSSLVPERSENKPGLQPLRRRVDTTLSAASEPAMAPAEENSARLLEAEMVEQRNDRLALAMSMTVDDEAAPRAVFVVLQTAQYREAGPMLWTICVWHVTVLDASRIPAESRIPAKQI